MGRDMKITLLLGCISNISNEQKCYNFNRRKTSSLQNSRKFVHDHMLMWESSMAQQSIRMVLRWACNKETRGKEKEEVSEVDAVME